MNTIETTNHIPSHSTTRWGEEEEEEEEQEPFHSQVNVDDKVNERNLPSSSHDSHSPSGHPPHYHHPTLSSHIPPTHTSRVDSKGIKLITSYRTNPSHPSTLLKTVTKIRVHKVTVKEHVSVAKRRTWTKFGQAAMDEAEGNTNVTIQSRDDIYLEDPHADTDLQEEDATKALAGNLNEFWAKQQRRQLERKYDVAEGGMNVTSTAAAAAGGGGEGGEGGWQMVGSGSGAGAGSSGGAGKYIPPSARGGGVTTGSGGLAALANRIEKAGGPMTSLSSSAGGQENLNTIRVTNISEETTEADLQQLFQKFGRISRVYLAKDKETLQSRGFAFVSYVHVQDAANAMEKLQGFGFDHLILKLEWARPSAPKNPSMEGTEYRSGYGKALAQDTKEKVTFASNLTTGTR